MPNKTFTVKKDKKTGETFNNVRMPVEENTDSTEKINFLLHL